jgi:hypothetical protein
MRFKGSPGAGSGPASGVAGADGSASSVAPARAAGAGEAGELPTEAPTCAGAGDVIVVAPETGVAGIGIAAPRPDGGVEDDDGGQDSGGRDRGWESARVRGRWVPACLPPPVRLRGSGAPIACIRSGTWLGSTT